MYGNTGVASGTVIPINFYTGPPFAGFGSCTFNTRASYATRGFKSRHPGGCNMLFADGHVNFLKGVDQPVHVQLCFGSRNGGEVGSVRTCIEFQGITFQVCEGSYRYERR